MKLVIYLFEREGRVKDNQKAPVCMLALQTPAMVGLVQAETSTGNSTQIFHEDNRDPMS